MITNEYTRLALSDITVRRDERQRRDLDLDRGGLLESIRRRGVLQPIVVRRQDNGGGDWYYELVAGERRYASSVALELPDIPVRFVEDLPPIELQIIELEENLHRQDLVWQDLVRSVARIHLLYTELNPVQEQAQTAEAIGLTPGAVSMYITVSRGLEDESIAKCGTVREAYNFLDRRKKREQGDTLEDILSAGELALPMAPTVHLQDELENLRETSPGRGEVAPLSLLVPLPTIVSSSSASPILCSDFLHWAPRYSGPKFNFIHCDFPYGIGAFSSNGQRSGEGRSQMGRDGDAPYDDSEDTYRALVQCLCENFNRLASSSCHLMFWFSNKHEIELWTREQFAQVPGLQFSRFPLVWFKSDNAGVAAIPTQEPRHVYECALLATRGGRQLIKVAADCYSAPSLRKDGETIKPPGVLRHFFSMFVDQHSRVLDPTCGSGSAIVAAEGLGAQNVMGLELDLERAERAGKTILEERNKRRAAMLLGA